MSIICLTGKIKGLASESQKLQRKANRLKASTLEAEKKAFAFHNLNMDKYSLRSEARNHLLAYAFVRNVPYKKVEQKCEVKPHLDKILEIVLNAGYLKRPDAKTGKYRLVPIWFSNKDSILVKITEWFKAEV